MPAHDNKPHSDITERAIADLDRHNIAMEIDPVPMPDNGSHSHSHAAHLGEHTKGNTKPAGNLRQGAAPGSLREPPMVVSRIGKEHRKQ